MSYPNNALRNVALRAIQKEAPWALVLVLDVDNVVPRLGAEKGAELLGHFENPSVELIFELLIVRCVSNCLGLRHFLSDFLHDINLLNLKF